MIPNRHPAAITGVPAADIEHAARTLWESRPVAFYAWSGLEQHSNTTQTIRAINQLYALIGDFDAAGGNVLFAGVPSNRVDGTEPGKSNASTLMSISLWNRCLARTPPTDAAGPRRTQLTPAALGPSGATRWPRTQLRTRD